MGKYDRDYYNKNKEKIIAMNRIYSQANHEKALEYSRNSCRRRSDRLRAGALEALGNKCKHCNNKDIRVLQIDHVFGGGNKELKNGNYRRLEYLQKVINEKDDGQYQLLCSNCNIIKAHELKELNQRII